MKAKYQTTDGTPIEVRRMHADDRLMAKLLREDGNQVALSAHLDSCRKFYGERIVRVVTA